MITVLSVVHGNTFGGPHNRNVLVARALADSGIRVVVLVPAEAGEAADRMKASGLKVVEVPIHRLRAKPDPRYHWDFVRGFRRSVAEIERILQDEQIDVVQINGISNPHAAVAARRRNVPIVWQILDTFPPKWFLRLMMPYVLRSAGTIMSTGHRVAAAHPGINPRDSRLIYFYPPVDLHTFRWDPKRAADARKELGIPSAAPVVGNVSNLNPQKGHRTFIRAAARLRERCKSARFVILGRTYDAHRGYAEALFREAKGLGMKLGHDLIVRDPGARVVELEMAFDVFAMTSEPRSEGIPTVIEEAMALGLPVVSTDVGSIAEIVSDGKTGRLVPPRDPQALADAIAGLIADPDLAKGMGQRARAVAIDKFPLESCTQRHLEAYRLALGGEGLPKQIGARLTRSDHFES